MKHEIMTVSGLKLSVEAPDRDVAIYRAQRLGFKVAGR